MTPSSYSIHQKRSNLDSDRQQGIGSRQIENARTTVEEDSVRQMITNRKIGFRRYAGVSLLFDNPGDRTLAPMGSAFQRIDLDVDKNPSLRFYAALFEGLCTIGLGSLASKHLLLPLPAQSYHVTVLDGLNEHAKHKIFPEHQSDFEDFLLGLPASLLTESKFTRPFRSAGVLELGEPVSFRFQQLAIWDASVLVALLEPADAGSAKACERVRDFRSGLYEALRNEIGFVGGRPVYKPHVSLGYFGNEDRGREAERELSSWNEVFEKLVADETIRFVTIQLYGFLDMETFFCETCHGLPPRALD